MIELHGWLTIRDTYKNEDKFIVDEYKSIFLVNKLIKELKWNTIQLKSRNGTCYIEITVFANRKTPEIDEISEFIKNVIIVAEGSYGIVYYWDDEDTFGRDNEFQVYIIAKGKIISQKDTYLSPCIPTIESE